MRNRLIIGELSYLQEVTEETLVGGAVAITGTMTTATPVSASASAIALANGQYVTSATQTQVITGSRFSAGNATAAAFAVTGNSAALALSLSNSTALRNVYSSSSSSYTAAYSFTIANP
ncbi:hypothetical protein [Fortiea contorta]|uniref:hypothetical protein n=1 Tax=Fortiea contorta TaxID=1892405 RepID=UPI0012B5506C|nr:hypothetical protein [Fortiea contorta]